MKLLNTVKNAGKAIAISKLLRKKWVWIPLLIILGMLAARVVYYAGYRTGRLEELLPSRGAAVSSVSPRILSHDYKETLFLIQGKGFGGVSDISVKIGPERLTGVAVTERESQEFITGILEVSPNKKRLSPGRYNLTIKLYGRPIARVFKVEVLPNPYGFDPGNRQKAAIAMAIIFIVGVISAAFYFIYRRYQEEMKKKKP